MVESWVFVAAAAVVLVSIAVLASRRRLASRNSTLLAFGSSLVALGVVFGEDRLVGYSFIGAGVVLSLVSALRDRKGSNAWRRIS